MNTRNTRALVLVLAAVAGMAAIESVAQTLSPAPETSAAVSAPSTGPVTAADALISTEPPTQRSVWIDRKPPAPLLEVVPLTPGTNYVWIKGFWAYRGGEWNWVPGTWVMRPAPGFVWVDGQWAKNGRGWIWVKGSWRQTAPHK